MSTKEDPLQSVTRSGSHTVWLDRESFREAREAYYALVKDQMNLTSEDKRTWDIACAAYMAMHAYVWEGRVGP
jgi:hypothetical protein